MRPRFLVVIALMLGGGLAMAEETVDVCFNYGCSSEDAVVFAESRLSWVQTTLMAALDPGAERELLGLVIGRLYAWAGEQTPVWRDRGGNREDDEVNGRMDCIDHSTTTHRFLGMLAQKGWLRFHRVLEPARRTRFLFSQHFSAVIEQLGPAREEAGGGPVHFAVDSWFVDNGHPPVIMPLDEWLDGGGPDE